MGGETPKEHKKHKEVHELWEEIEKRDTETAKEEHDVVHQDREEESTREEE